jgi:hypothetical protein
MNREGTSISTVIIAVVTAAHLNSECPEITWILNSLDKLCNEV